MRVINLNNKNEMIDTGLIGKYDKTIEDTKGKSTRAPLRIGHGLRCSGRVSSFCSTFDTCCATAKRQKHYLIWKPCFTSVDVSVIIISVC